MRRAVLAHAVDLAGWREAARRHAAGLTAPEALVWSVAGEDGELFVGTQEEPLPARRELRVPRAFLPLAENVVLHRDPARFAVLYRLLFRLQDEPRLLDLAYDGDVTRAAEMAKAVRRDLHKMKAFVRFRETADEAGAHFVAWFEPDHHILEAAAPFFVRRFAAMRWSILTPERCAMWDRAALSFGPGAARAHAPDGDDFEEVWRTYYAHIFNPARLKVDAMRAEMPRRYWRNLPEAPLIRPLIEAARPRAEAMIMAAPKPARANPQRGVPAHPAPQAAAGSLEEARNEAFGCRACPLWAPATQTVFGEGPANAAAMFVGEQPGDREDLEGRPFVGPAGQLFDRALADAGIDRRKLYVTNAVKHFKFLPRGKLRLHQKPGAAEIKACRPWLGKEMDLVRPRLVVAMGATAVQSVFGKAMPIGANRGTLIDLDAGTRALITVHPSYLLRVEDARRAAEYDRFVADLRLTLPLLADA